jgi:8-oxo-dGTP diphosphatase
MRNVSILIFYDEDKKVLLQNRIGIDKHGWEWGFFGGGIEQGETPEQTIVREIKEELDFDLKDFRFIGNYNVKEYGDLYAFISKLGDNLSKFRQLEGESMQLFSLEEVENLKISERDKKVIQDMKKILAI